MRHGVSYPQGADSTARLGSAGAGHTYTYSAGVQQLLLAPFCCWAIHTSQHILGVFLQPICSSAGLRTAFIFHKGEDLLARGKRDQIKIGLAHSLREGKLIIAHHCATMLAKISVRPCNRRLLAAFLFDSLCGGELPVHAKQKVIQFPQKKVHFSSLPESFCNAASSSLRL